MAGMEVLNRGHDRRTGGVALVTGARRGIGAAIAVGLAGAGGTVIIHHLDAAHEARTVVDSCREKGADSFAVEADLRNPAAIAALGDELEATAGGVDVLVNNAAQASSNGLAALSQAEWDDVVAVNLTAALLLSQRFVPRMAANGWGRIINITSATVRQGGPSGPAYVTTKAGLVGMTRSLAKELGRSGITVNAVSPGAIMTEAEAELFNDEAPGDLNARILAKQALARRVLPWDVAHLVVYLVSPEADALTGQVIEINGGSVLR
jgi:NAD(P)-dependent dehydrogenase (short-subunit alcohol dehydrogenase family)